MLYFSMSEMIGKSSSEFNEIVENLMPDSYIVFEHTGCYMCKGCDFCTVSSPSTSIVMRKSEWRLVSKNMFNTEAEAQEYSDLTSNATPMFTCNSFTFIRSGSTEILNCVSIWMKN